MCDDGHCLYCLINKSNLPMLFREKQGVVLRGQVKTIDMDVLNNDENKQCSDQGGVQMFAQEILVKHDEVYKSK